MNEEKLKKLLLQYSFYDDQHKLNIVLNKNYLKELFEADIILLDETQHK